jgi:hypothetical protein
MSCVVEMYMVIDTQTPIGFVLPLYDADLSLCPDEALNESWILGRSNLEACANNASATYV